MNGIKRQTIMLVDDNRASLTMGKSILEKYYDVYALPSADKLFQFLKRVRPDLILLDIDMPEMNGYETMTVLKADKQLSDIPVIFVTAMNSESDEYEGLALGAIDYVTKPFSAALLLKRIENHLLTQNQKLKLQDFNENLIKMVKGKMQQVYGLQNAIVGTVADLLEFRDHLTGWHATRTQEYLRVLIDQLIEDDVYTDELLSWDIEMVVSSSPLHDVGKICISDTLLNKPGKLTPEEAVIMRTHVLRGVEAIERMEGYGYVSDFLEHAKMIVRSHHEKWDGSGYPHGLAGYDIPLEGRMMAIADVYDALISARPYKKMLTAEESADIVIEGSGTHFDPALVEVFKKLTGQFAKIAGKYRDEANKSRHSPISLALLKSVPTCF